MNKTAIIFGAGKTGRGFAAQLAFLSGYDIILVDKNRQLVTELSRAGQYEVKILGNTDKSSIIKLSGAYHIDDVSWQEAFVCTDLIFTAVFGNNLPALAQQLSTAFEKRYHQNQTGLLTIITCENLANAAGYLKKMVLENIRIELQRWLNEVVGFSESIVFRTCLDPPEHESRLTILAQNFFELPCDADAMKAIPTIYGLKPLQNFTHQLRRKIYTYNCINAVITYLGAKKGYTQLSAAANDEAILSIAHKAANESSLAQVAEFNFDRDEQDAWMQAAFEKFADKDVPDPIIRNGADPARKLGRDDRLIGPALLALKHGIYPEGLLAGIIACFEYTDPETNFSVAELIAEKGIALVLETTCGLSREEELYKLILKQVIT